MTTMLHDDYKRGLLAYATDTLATATRTTRVAWLRHELRLTLRDVEAYGHSGDTNLLFRASGALDRVASRLESRDVRAAADALRELVSIARGSEPVPYEMLTAYESKG